MTSDNTHSNGQPAKAREGWGGLFRSHLHMRERHEKHPPQPSLDDLPRCPDQRLAELRRQWQQCPDRRAQIEAEAQEIKAMHLLRTHLGAEVLGETEVSR